jgi:hypothetical protein
MIDIDLLIHEIEKEECLWKTNSSNCIFIWTNKLNKNREIM